MLDFLIISERSGKRGVIEIFPDYHVRKSSDLMIRGRDFYCIWDKDRGLWSKDEDDAIRLIDNELDIYAEEKRRQYPDQVYKVLHLRTASNRMIKMWHSYVKEDMRDNYVSLDSKLTFADTKVKKSDHVSKRLPYSPEHKETPAYDRMMETWYSEENRHKIEWCFGCVLSGASVDTQKFATIYGPPGSGKGSILQIGDMLFKGYTTAFEVKTLVKNGEFAFEAFRDNPLVAIQYDGDLSRIEDNAKLNSIVSHESVLVNTKFKSPYQDRFKCFLLLGTNKPVKITDARSGLIRRLIDISPTGKKLPGKEYTKLMAQVEFELGGIAQRCLDVYLKDPGYYDDYIPYSMMSASDDFYNFVADRYLELSQDDHITGSAAYDIYQKYCDFTNVPFKMKYSAFTEELKAYYKVFEERHTNEDGTRTRSWYSGFRTDKIEGLEYLSPEPVEPEEPSYSLEFDSEDSQLDIFLKDYPAQYASSQETPQKPWDLVSTKLSDLNTRELHYVRVPENLIVIDFDIPDQNGEKSYEKNLEEASKWPPTYAELSKSGKGIHLHYIYTGDPEQLAYLYKEHVEIKVFTGKSSLRRKLSKCNSLTIATISSGLPLKGEKPVVQGSVIKSNASLQRFIQNCLMKKYEPHATKPMVEFIYTKLEEAYASGLSYDVTGLHESIRNFALGSTHNAEYCLKLVAKMKFKSTEESEQVDSEETTLVFYDVEVFPNLFIVCWKPIGPGKEVIAWINPTPEQVYSLFKYRLVGFNNRRYDNHILWAYAVCGYSIYQLYLESQKIIANDPEAYWRDAYNISYTDIYDFSSVKQSLKKFEIELGQDHQELGMKWDEPVPEDRWDEVAGYCVNDVLATEAVWNARQADFAARKVLVAIANASVR